MLTINCAGWAMQLLPSGAIYLPDVATLLVADAHFGKAVSFRLAGVPVPQGTTTETLQRLSNALAQTRSLGSAKSSDASSSLGATHVIFLGDFLHSAKAHAAPTQHAIASWRAKHPELALTLVRGNHDDRAGDPPAALGVQVVDEPLMVTRRAANLVGDAAPLPNAATSLVEAAQPLLNVPTPLVNGVSPLALCHHPQLVPGAYVLAGHAHPCVVLTGAGRDRLRLPCFWLGDATKNPVGVLPAFGSFTGMHPIARRPRDRVFAVAGSAVKEVPGS